MVMARVRIVLAVVLAALAVANAAADGGASVTVATVDADAAVAALDADAADALGAAGDAVATAACACKQFFKQSPLKCIDCSGRVVANPAAKHAVLRSGKYYRSPRTNQYWRNGKWTPEPAARHPTDPWLRRLAGQWVRQPATVARKSWVRHGGQWWRGACSLQRYVKGKWVRVRRTDAHPTNPNMRYCSGRWVWRPKKQRSSAWVQIKGKWRKGRTGAAFATVYGNGRWHVPLAARDKASDPRYGLVKRRVVTTTTPAANGKPAVKKTGFKSVWRRLPLTRTRAQYKLRRGLWYRTWQSRSYYYKGKWYIDAAQHRDPRYRTRRGGKPCLANRACQAKKFRRLPAAKVSKKWVFSKNQYGPVVYRDSRRTHVWWYGAWRRAKYSRAQRIARAARKKRLNLAAAPGPIDLDGVVEGVLKTQIKAFLKWFDGGYLTGKVAYPGANPEVPEAGIDRNGDTITHRRTQYNPEPQEFPNPRNMRVRAPSEFEGTGDMSGTLSPTDDAFDSAARLKADLRKMRASANRKRKLAARRR
jgi:hypothetical protein